MLVVRADWEQRRALQPEESVGNSRFTPAAVTQPIYLSTTYERGADGKYPRGFSYSREDNPNRRALEHCLAAHWKMAKKPRFFHRARR